MSLPLYVTIAEDLARKIAEGVYPVGSVLPAEVQLAADYNASRQTLRTALRQLQDLGLISRKRGSGTLVEAARPSAGYSQSLSSLEDLVQWAATAPRVVQRMETLVIDTELAAQTGCPQGARWLCISSTRVYHATAAPLAWTDLYVDSHYKGLRQLVRQHPEQLISGLLETRYGRRIATVDQTITACAIPDALAEPLRAPAGSPGLHILRQYRDQANGLVLASLSVHPLGRYTFSMRLIRETQAGPAAAPA